MAPHALLDLLNSVDVFAQDVTVKVVDNDTHVLQVRLLLLAALSQEHILYIGPPGTAKSELGRRLSRLCAGTFFERLLTRFSVPEVALPLTGAKTLVHPIGTHCLCT